MGRFGVSGERVKGRVGSEAEPDGRDARLLGGTGRTGWERGSVGDQACWNPSKALAAARGGARAGKPRWVRILVTTGGCSMAAMNFKACWTADRRPRAHSRGGPGGRPGAAGVLRGAGASLGGEPPLGTPFGPRPGLARPLLLSGQKVWRRRRPNAPGEGAAATLQNRVEIPILHPMNSEDPDPYRRTRSTY